MEKMSQVMRKELATLIQEQSVKNQKSINESHIKREELAAKKQTEKKSVQKPPLR